MVLIGFAAWMGTGKFSSVGSAAPEAEARKVETEKPALPLRTVAVLKPPRAEHARAIRISGQTEAEKRALLATRVMGVIERLPVRQGEHVNKGDLILRLEAEDKEAAIRMAEIVVMQRQAETGAAERLVKGGNAPKLQADQARAALAAAQAELENAKAELAQHEIHAPFNGVIDRVPVERGSAIMAGSEVATLINLDPLLAIGEVSERDLQFLKLGSEADIRLVDGTTVKGTLRYISRDASAATRTFRIEVAIPNRGQEAAGGHDRGDHAARPPADAIVLPRSVVTLSATATSASGPSTRTPMSCSSRSTSLTTRRGVWFWAASRPTPGSSSPARIWLPKAIASTSSRPTRRPSASLPANSPAARNSDTEGKPMDIVGLAIRNARLTLAIMFFFLVAGRAGVSVGAEGSRARHRRFRSSM